MLRIGFGEHAQKHLSVRGNPGQRRVHFVGHTGRKQSDRRQLLALLQLFLEPYAGSYIFHHHQSPGALVRVNAKRRNRNVQDQGAACFGGGVQFVNIAQTSQSPAVRPKDLVQRVGKVNGKKIFDTF